MSETRDIFRAVFWFWVGSLVLAFLVVVLLDYLSPPRSTGGRQETIMMRVFGP